MINSDDNHCDKNNNVVNLWTFSFARLRSQLFLFPVVIDISELHRDFPKLLHIPIKKSSIIIINFFKTFSP